MSLVASHWYGLPVAGPATGRVIDFGTADLPPVPALQGDHRPRGQASAG